MSTMLTLIPQQSSLLLSMACFVLQQISTRAVHFLLFIVLTCVLERRVPVWQMHFLFPWKHLRTSIPVIGV